VSWSQADFATRDRLPHRGESLVRLADTGLLLGVLALPLGCLALTALACGVVAWWLAIHDLQRMRSGLMDPAGDVATRCARSRGLAGAALGVYAALVWMGFLSLVM
jgi:hypothetical protein